MQINKVHFPVTALGFGKRVGIWTQGCSIRCPGCVSRDTWTTHNQCALGVAELVSGIKPWLDQADGVTISGGEPFDQAPALGELMRLLKSGFPGDVLVYSGYSFQRLWADFSEVLLHADVVVSEPFLPECGQTLALRGSDNQRICLLTELARSRYPDNIDRQLWEGNRRMDVVVEGDNVWMAGIPRTGDMGRLRDELARCGYNAQSSDEPLIRA